LVQAAAARIPDHDYGVMRRITLAAMVKYREKPFGTTGSLVIMTVVQACLVLKDCSALTHYVNQTRCKLTHSPHAGFPHHQDGTVLTLVPLCYLIVSEYGGVTKTAIEIRFWQVGGDRNRPWARIAFAPNAKGSAAPN
jgi:hypothetical protein